MFDSQNRKINFGLLIMRLGLTAVLFLHSLPKLFAGAHSWKSLGTSLSFINIGLSPMIFGFAILFLETLGAVSFVFGYFFRAACTILFMLFGLQHIQADALSPLNSFQKNHPNRYGGLKFNDRI